MSDFNFEQALDSPEATAELAHNLADLIEPGDTILLTGGIGAGKTHFARSLITALLEVPEDVPSPTFTLVQTYETEKGALWHADLYRLGGPDEVAELGLLDAFGTEICLIEWPDRLGEDTPPHALHLTFEQGKSDDARILRIEADGSKWAGRLKELMHDHSA